MDIWLLLRALDPGRLRCRQYDGRYSSHPYRNEMVRLLLHIFICNRGLFLYSNIPNMGMLKLGDFYTQYISEKVRRKRGNVYADE